MMADKQMWASAQALVEIYGDQTLTFIQAKLDKFKEAEDTVSVAFWGEINIMADALGVFQPFFALSGPVG